MQKKLFPIIIILLILGIYFYTHSANISAVRKKDKSATVAVSAEKIVQKNVTAYFDTIGTVQPYTSVAVQSQVDGQIINVGFTEGQLVQKDQLLFTVDPRPFQIALQQAQANLAKDQAQLNNARLNLQRNEKLLKKGYVAAQDYDQLRANEEALAATVKADQAAVADAQLQLSYTQITAPISGRTGDILIKPGNLIKTAAGVTLVTINQIQPIYVSFTVPQHYLPAIQKTQAIAPLTVIAHISKQHKNEQGQLTFINNAIDTSTGTVQLKATFANDDQLLWPGQYVKIHLPIAAIKNALIIPAKALQTGQQGTYVFVIRDGKAYSKTVKTGPTVQEGVVIEQGLQVNDEVVTEGQFLLDNDTAVKIVPSKY